MTTVSPLHLSQAKNRKNRVSMIVASNEIENPELMGQINQLNTKLFQRDQRIRELELNGIEKNELLRLRDLLAADRKNFETERARFLEEHPDATLGGAAAVTELQEKLAASERRREEEAVAARRRADELSERLALAEAKVAAPTKTDGHQATIEALEISVKEALAAKEHAAEKARFAEQQREEVAGKLAAAEEDLAGLRAALKAERQQNNELAASLEAARLETREARATCGETETELRALISQQEAQITALQTTQEQTQSALSQTTGLVETAEEYKRRLEEVEGKLDKKTAEVEELTSRLAEALTKRATEKAALQEANAKIKEVKEQLDAVAQKRALEREEAEQKESASRKQEEQITATEQRVQDVLKAKAECDAWMQETKETIARLEAEKEKVQQENEALRREKEEMALRRTEQTPAAVVSPGGLDSDGPRANETAGAEQTACSPDSPAGTKPSPKDVSGSPTSQTEVVGKEPDATGQAETEHAEPDEQGVVVTPDTMVWLLNNIVLALKFANPEYEETGLSIKHLLERLRQEGVSLMDWPNWVQQQFEEERAGQ